MWRNEDSRKKPTAIKEAFLCHQVWISMNTLCAKIAQVLNKHLDVLIRAWCKYEAFCLF
jgi:hypothetical protein